MPHLRQDCQPGQVLISSDHQEACRRGPVPGGRVAAAPLSGQESGCLPCAGGSSAESAGRRRREGAGLLKRPSDSNPRPQALDDPSLLSTLSCSLAKMAAPTPAGQKKRASDSASSSSSFQPAPFARRRAMAAALLVLLLGGCLPGPGLAGWGQTTALDRRPRA